MIFFLGITDFLFFLIDKKIHFSIFIFLMVFLIFFLRRKIKISIIFLLLFLIQIILSIHLNFENKVTFIYDLTRFYLIPIAGFTYGSYISRENFNKEVFLLLLIYFFIYIFLIIFDLPKLLEENNRNLMVTSLHYNLINTAIFISIFSGKFFLLFFNISNIIIYIKRISLLICFLRIIDLRIIIKFYYFLIFVLYLILYLSNIQEINFNYKINQENIFRSDSIMNSILSEPRIIDDYKQFYLNSNLVNFLFGFNLGGNLIENENLSTLITFHNGLLNFIFKNGLIIFLIFLYHINKQIKKFNADDRNIIYLIFFIWPFYDIFSISVSTFILFCFLRLGFK